ncbi:uncharacterized protein LOC129358875 [Poeciliopsis prolifica]|uniref:uncharacterized protein LOC129358875 n=1 Tax=Poeciliopsis prolifica TaxID=188132 RepID=UPI0024138B8A|nr:uncharacterized protein LOC129358875 [Poeciliopsis prolifica]
MADLSWIENFANSCRSIGRKIAKRYRKKQHWSPDYAKKRTVGDLLWKVIEKVADMPTLHHIRETFEVAHIQLLRQIMKETGKLELSLLMEMSDELSERIFQSIARDSFHIASELHLFTILFYPEAYPRIVKEFKYHLENPILPEPTKTERFLSSVRTVLTNALFDTESLYSDENCLGETRSIAARRRKSLIGYIELIKHGTEKERRKMVNIVVWKLICKASYRSATPYKLRHTVPVYQRLSVVVWEELQDLDFLIFYKMEKKLSKDIFQLLTGNEDICGVTGGPQSERRTGELHV